MFSRLLRAGSGFFFKALISLLLLNGLTIGVLIYISYTFSEASVTSQAQDRITQELDHLVIDFKRKYLDQVSRSLFLLENSALMDAYLRGTSAEKLVISRRMERRLKQIQQDYPYYQDIQFLDADGNFSFGVHKGRRSFPAQDDKATAGIDPDARTRLFSQLKEVPLLLSSGNMEWFMPAREMLVIGPVQDKAGEYMLLAGHSKLDKDTGGFAGAFVIELGFDHLFRRLKGILVNGNSPVWLFDMEGNVLFNPDSAENEYQLDPRPVLNSEPQPRTRLINNEHGVVAYRDIKRLDGNYLMRMVFSVSRQLLVQDLEPASNFFSLVAFFSLAFSILLSLLVSRYLSGPFKALTLARNQLTTAHRLARLGHWEWDEKTETINLSENSLVIFGRENSQTTIDLAGFIAYAVVDDRKRVEEKIREAIFYLKATKIDYYLLTDKGEERYVHQEIDVIHDDPVKVIGTIQDLTERRSTELRISELAYHDAVTGLANRTLLHKLAEAALIEATEQQKMLAMLFLDLDHFKRVNDTLGHEAGDELLRKVSMRLHTCLRPTDTIGSGSIIDEDKSTVARLGGDEFIIMLTALSSEQDAIHVAERILLSLNQSFEISSSKVNTNCSIGISFYPIHGQDITTLLRHADSAMYQAKSNGRSQYAIYNQQLDQNLRYRQKMEFDLQNALHNEEFFLEYQPRMDLHRNSLDSFEVLIRWQHPQQGLIGPDEFIMLAERTGVIIPIGSWIMQCAFKQLAEWQKKYARNLGLSINLSPVQFGSKAIVQEISSTLSRYGVLSSCVEFEITEQALINDASSAIEIANGIKEIGCSLSIDDFGTGYSSLQQLRQLPVDILKIDKSFVHEMLTNSDDESIVRASIELGHSLGLKVVAEGVELSGQATRLKALGCDELQGNYFGPPQTAELISELLQSEQMVASF